MAGKRRRRGKTASSPTVDVWLLATANRSAQPEIEKATVEYYRALTQAERSDNETLAHSLSRAARKLSIDTARSETS